MTRNYFYCFDQLCLLSSLVVYNEHGLETSNHLKQSRKSALKPTINFDTLRYDLKSHHPEVVDITLFQLFFVEVQDEGQVVVQIIL